jgi:DNA-binding PadR family transcriptional regulator
MHGYAIGRWIRQTTSDALDIKEGALYPALHRLQRKELLDEEWGLTESNREAKFYKLTPAGRKHLKLELARWRDFSRVMSVALDAVRV